MAEKEAQRPGEQQVIHRSHQAQAICMTEQWNHQAKINIGAAVIVAHGKRAKQPNGLHLWPGGQQLDQKHLA